LLNLIKTSKVKSFFEFIPDNTPVKLFFDIEIFQDKYLDLYNKSDDIVQVIKNVFGNEYILLESHQEGIKKSFHVIFPNIIFKNVKELKIEIQSINEFKGLVQEKIIDTSVYREGLLRTIYSSKVNETRPLIYSTSSPLKNCDKDTFICDIPEDTVNFSKQLSSKITPNLAQRLIVHKPENDSLQALQMENIIKHFVHKVYNYKSSDISSIIKSDNHFIVALNDKFCNNIDREHKSNHQYIVIDSKGSRIKCHDPECKNFKNKYIKYSDLPENIQEIIKEHCTLNVETKLNDIDNNTTDTMLNNAKNDCPKLINEAFYDKIEHFDYDDDKQMFHANAKDINKYLIPNGCKDGCMLQHCINSEGFNMICKTCNKSYPGIIQKTPEKYTGLHQYFVQINVNITNNNTIINNNYNSDIISCITNLDPAIFNDLDLTSHYNQILSGHKIVKISELLHKFEQDFLYSEKEWFYFNGVFWENDQESLTLHDRLVKLCVNFDTIIKFYENLPKIDSNEKIIKNVTSLIGKLHKPGFQDEIIRGAKFYYRDKDFKIKIDSKKQLVPFNNGAYDLTTSTFRKTTKEDFITLTMDYDYDPDVFNQDVQIFIEQVLPDKYVRDYVLKKFSECLNGDIPNTHFLMFLGDGANGKSQLLNLMKYTMGKFGEKVEVTLLTRKRTNANETNSEKIKLKGKLFAFLSEPEDGEHFNISLLKEMTGSEEIVARGLFKESTSFCMEAKLFLGCNELPPIKGEDKALWRRIRVVRFPSRFVYEPTEENEYQIDQTLPSRIRDNISWRQTFLNILLGYYYKTVPEPESVKIETDEYQDDNNELEQWISTNVIYVKGGTLQLKEVCEKKTDKVKTHSRVSSKIKKELENYIKKNFINEIFEFRDITINQTRIKGWINFQLL
jgi:P4 family phage/plasmid primase-like protien